MIASLPAPLAPWRPLLGLLHRHAAEVLEPLIGRLDVLFGPDNVARSGAEGPPDGYDGLARRGPLDRLVASQWALLDAAPDEFLRRFGSGELLHHQLAFRTSAPTSRLLLYFDTGPDQLGAPRLFHLAALLLLAGRAEASRRPIAFGSIQGGPLCDAVTVENIKGLLAARTGEPIPDWLGPGSPALAAGTDTWWFGGADLGRRAPPGTRVLIGEEPFAEADPDRRLSVEVHRAGGRLGTAVLAIPESSAHILRNPFAPRPRPSSAPRRPEDGPDFIQVAPHTDILLTRSTHRVVVRTVCGQLAVLSPGPKPGSFKACLAPVAPPARIIAVGAGHWLHVVVAYPDGLPGSRLAGPGPMPILVAGQLGRNGGPAGEPPVMVPGPRHWQEAGLGEALRYGSYIQDAGREGRLVADPPSGRGLRGAPDERWFLSAGTGLAAKVSLSTGEWSLLGPTVPPNTGWRLAAADLSLHDTWEQGVPHGKTFFGATHKDFGTPLAILDKGGYRLAEFRRSEGLVGDRLVDPPSGWRVVGVARLAHPNDSRTMPELGLFVVSRDGCGFGFARGGGVFHLPSPRQAIEQVALAPNRDEIAFGTVGGGLDVRSIWGTQPTFRVEMGQRIPVVRWPEWPRR